MSAFEAIVLGIVQGITEFLPISSTGHLILAREVLRLDTHTPLAVDATLHLATGFAVLWYFRVDIGNVCKAGVRMVFHPREQNPHRTLFIALLLGTIPAVVCGLLFESKIETVFRDVTHVAWVLIAGSVLFVCAEWVVARASTRVPLSLSRGIGIGFFQSLALLPGMSRSGATIAGGMLLGLTRESAARFAFLLSLPIILGAGGLKLYELGSSGVASSEWGMIALATCSAFFTGLIAIHFLLTFLKQHTLLVFVVYRVALAMVLFAMF